MTVPGDYVMLIGFALCAIGWYIDDWGPIIGGVALFMIGLPPIKQDQPVQTEVCQELPDWLWACGGEPENAST